VTHARGAPARHQVRGVGFERDPPSVPAQRRGAAGGIGGFPVGAGADAVSDERSQVPHQHLRGRTGRAARDEVSRLRHEHHQRVVSAEGRCVARARSRTPVGRPADAPSSLHEAIPQVDLAARRARRVEVRRHRVERHEPAIGTDRRVQALARRPDARDADAHPAHHQRREFHRTGGRRDQPHAAIGTVRLATEGGQQRARARHCHHDDIDACRVGDRTHRRAHESRWHADDSPATGPRLEHREAHWRGERRHAGSIAAHRDHPVGAIGVAAPAPNRKPVSGRAFSVTT
jgi:hypothetical protein